MEEADKVEAMLRSSKRDMEKKGTILVRTAGPMRREREAVELLAGGADLETMR